MSENISAPMPPASPLRYSVELEKIEPDEHDTNAALVETMHGITETTSAHYGHAVRSVHAKSLGLLEGELTVLDNLPSALAQGLFAKPGMYPVVMRFSTAPGDIIDDSISTPRGLAIKVEGVEGARLQPGDDGNTQDIVLVDAPAFIAPNPKAFLKSLKLLASTTDRAEGAKKVLATALRGAEAVLEAFGGESATLKSLGGHPITNPLGETYYSQTPFRYGDYVAKFAVFPISPDLTALKNAAVDLGGSPDGLRKSLVDYFHGMGGGWELRVQLATDLETTPIEDASAVWPQDKSPYIAVARIRVEPQTAWSPERAKLIDDGLAFSPWHGLAAHQPLGGINRARKPAYEMSSDFRGERNGCPIHEPREHQHLPT